MNPTLPPALGTGAALLPPTADIDLAVSRDVAVRPDTAARTDAGTDAGAGVNWIWLLDLERWDRVLVVGSDPGRAALLANYFGSVEHRDSVLPDGRARRSASAHADRVDCIVLTDVVAVAGAERRRLFAQLRGLLRDGGALVCTVENAAWGSRWLRPPTGARPAAALPGTVVRQLRATGFAEIRPYCVQDSAQAPRTFLPATRRAVLAYDRQFAPASRSRAVRRLLLHAGGHHLLYRHLTFFAHVG